jgi:hypothetical protein
MTTSPSETRLAKLANRIVEWAKDRKLDQSDLDLVVDLTVALREAEKSLIEAGLFAQMVAAPQALDFGWASGSVPFDPAAAIGLLVHEAAHVEAMIAEQLYPGDSSDEEPEEEPRPALHRYVISEGSTEIVIESSKPLSDYERSEIVRRCLTPLCLPFDGGIVVDAIECDGPRQQIVTADGRVIGTCLESVNLGKLSDLVQGRRGV